MTSRTLGCAAVHALLAHAAFCKVIHARDYETKEPRDRNVLFAMTITPNQDVLSLVAKGNGMWRLTRIANWDGPHPSEQTIDIPGWARKDLLTPVSMLGTYVLVTKDSHYAICVASGFFPVEAGKAGGTHDDLISVVSLSDFSVRKTLHAPASGSEARSYHLNAADDLVVRAVDTAQGDHRVRLIQMRVPEMTVTAECRYREKIRFGEIDSRADETCRSVMGQPLVTYLGSLTGGPQLLGESNTAPCSAERTNGGKFNVELCRTYTAWFDEPHLTYRINIRSADDKVRIGSLPLTDHNSVQYGLAHLGSRDFILIVEGGTKLKVYEITV